jgi:hypothetical protein
MADRQFRGNTHCANCGTDILNAKCTGVSSIYQSGGIDLCETCYLMEDDLIDQQGTNVLPERLKHYNKMLERFSE